MKAIFAILILATASSEAQETSSVFRDCPDVVPFSEKEIADIQAGKPPVLRKYLKVVTIESSIETHTKKDAPEFSRKEQGTEEHRPQVTPHDPNEGVTVDIARAQTLARSSKNPAAQREGMRLLAVAEQQRSEYRIRKQAEAGVITWDVAETKIAAEEARQRKAAMKDELQNLSDEVVMQQEAIDREKKQLEWELQQAQQEKRRMEQELEQQRALQDFKRGR